MELRTVNTYRIYEEFRESLGEAAAKSLAQTLGTMFEELKNTVTKEDFRILRESIDGNMSRLDTAIVGLAEAQGRTESRVEELAVAQQRTESRVEELAVAQQRTESRVEELAEAQKRTESRVEELAVAQQRTESRIEELADSQKELSEAQQRTESSLQSLAATVERLSIRTDKVVGRTLELQFRDRLTSYLGLFLRRGRLLAAADLLDEIESKIDSREAEDFLQSDAVAKGIVAGEQTYVVAEVSATADSDDVVRAARRAAILRKAGLPAIPLVACEAITSGTMSFARDQAVRIWLDGRLLEDAA
jgi:chromosome segregation ATPase